jgi:hypothetical protein
LSDGAVSLNGGLAGPSPAIEELKAARMIEPSPNGSPEVAGGDPFDEAGSDGTAIGRSNGDLDL